MQDVAKWVGERVPMLVLTIILTCTHIPNWSEQENCKDNGHSSFEQNHLCGIRVAIEGWMDDGLRGGQRRGGRGRGC